MSDFWRKLRGGAGELSALFNGRRNASPLTSATPTQRGVALGHAPGVLTSDHFNELQHFKSWVFVGVDAIGKQWEQAAFDVFDTSWQERRGELGRRKSFGPDGPAEKRTPTKTHPVARLLKRPNPFKTGPEFMYQVACQLRLTGAALIYDVRDQAGDPCELWVIPRGWLSPLPPHRDFPLGGWRVMPLLSGAAGWYRNLPGDMASGFNLDIRQTIQVGRAHPLYPGEAMSPLEACSQLLDIMFQVDTATWASFVNAPKPSALISILDGSGPQSMPVTPEQIDQVKAQMIAMYAGASNAGRFIVGNNVGYQSLQPGPSELDYVNGRAQNRDNTLAIQNVPPIAVGLDSDGTYSGAAAKLNQFAELAIQPDLSLFAAKVTHHFQPLYGDDFEVEGRAKRYDDPTLKQKRADQIAAAFGQRVVTVNEYRASLDLEPMDGCEDLPPPELAVMTSAGAFTPDEMRETVGYGPLPGGQGASLPQAQQMGPDGQPVGQTEPGQPDDLAVGDVGESPGDSPGGAEGDSSYDLTPDLPDDTSTGTANPSRRGMPRAEKAWGGSGGTNGHAGRPSRNGHLSPGAVVEEVSAALTVRKAVLDALAETRSVSPTAADIATAISAALGRLTPATINLHPTPITLDVRSPDVSVHPTFNVAAPSVTVEAAAPVVVPAPVVNVEAPTVNVESPTVHVEAPAVNVEAPTVHVAAPAVTVGAPRVTVRPTISVPKPDPVSVVVNVPEPRPPAPRPPRTLTIANDDGTTTTATVEGG